MLADVGAIGAKNNTRVREKINSETYNNNELKSH